MASKFSMTSPIPIPSTHTKHTVRSHHQSVHSVAPPDRSGPPPMKWPQSLVALPPDSLDSPLPLSAKEKHKVSPCYPTLQFPSLSAREKHKVSPCYPTPQTLSLCLQTGILRLESHLSTVVATNLLLPPPHSPPHPPNFFVLRMEMSWNAEYSSLNSMGHYFPCLHGNRLWHTTISSMIWVCWVWLTEVCTTACVRIC